jgi:hypothetical protein
MKTDMRTKSGREQEIREQVKKYGGFSVFWVTETVTRAQAAKRMMKRGELKVTNMKFPFHKAKLIKQANNEKHPAI